MVASEECYGEFALITVAGWAFLLRILSECSPLTGQGAGGDLPSEDRLDKISDRAG